MQQAPRRDAKADTFAWPPTRKDLERIEVVDTSTQRPVEVIRLPQRRAWLNAR